jgi:hypothetical protein
MGIYENGPKPTKVSRSKTPPQKVNPKQIRNNKDLTTLVQQIKGGPKTAKEILYDTDKNIVGVLQRNDTPFFFTQAQIKELQILQGA